MEGKSCSQVGRCGSADGGGGDAADSSQVNRVFIVWDEPSLQCRYEDAYQYQNIFGPLVKIEADYDKRMKEAQTESDIIVRWDMGLNQRRLAWFSMPKLESGELKLAVGDELRLKYTGIMSSGAGGMRGLKALNSIGTSADNTWEGVGSVVKIPNSELCRI